MVSRIARIEAVVCDSAHEAAWLERNLLEAALPPWNRYPGSEVPTYLRLDIRPRFAGLSAVHDFEARGSGWRPVLRPVSRRRQGARRGRGNASRAAAAVHAPRDERRRAGFGRVRSASEADREWMLAATVAVLERDGDAVALAASGLAGLRDRAAERARVRARGSHPGRTGCADVGGIAAARH